MDGKAQWGFAPQGLETLTSMSRKGFVGGACTLSKAASGFERTLGRAALLDTHPGFSCVLDTALQFQKLSASWWKW